MAGASRAALGAGGVPGVKLTGAVSGVRRWSRWCRALTAGSSCLLLHKALNSRADIKSCRQLRLQVCCKSISVQPYPLLPAPGELEAYRRGRVAQVYVCVQSCRSQ